MVVVGSKASVADSRRSAEDFRLKLIRLEASDSALWSKVNEVTSVECIKTPLTDYLAFVADLHGGFSYELSDDVAADERISAHVSGAPLSWTLEATLLQYGLTLDFADDKLVIKRRSESK